MTARELDVYVHNRRVGRLIHPAPTEYRFTYRAKVKPSDSIALAMPVRDEPYMDTELFPIFAQQLPEPGSALYALIATRYSKLTDLTTDFDWLHLIGPHLNNRVRVAPAGQRPESVTSARSRFEDLDINQDSQELFEELFERVGLGGAGVSGMQPKLAIPKEAHSIDDRLTIAFDNDVIFKFAPEEGEYPGLLVNEYLCLESARAAGIEVHDVEINHDGGILVIRRFDRNGRGRSIGFEEASTLRFLSHRDKYSGSYEKMIKEMLDFISVNHQQKAKLQLFKMIAHIILTGNGDAHQKNFGVLYEIPSDVRVAPAYDLVSTLPYIKRDQPAVSFNGRKIWLTGKQLLEFANSTCDLSNSEAEDALEKVAHAVSAMQASIPEYIKKYGQYAEPLKALETVLGNQLNYCFE